jgi:hypothetical protein
MFRRIVVPPSSGSTGKPRKKARRRELQAEHSQLIAAVSLGVIFNLEGGESALLRNIGRFVPDYTALHPSTHLISLPFLGLINCAMNSTLLVVANSEWHIVRLEMTTA